MIVLSFSFHSLLNIEDAEQRQAYQESDVHPPRMRTTSRNSNSNQNNKRSQDPRHEPHLKRALISNAIALLQILINALTASDDIPTRSEVIIGSCLVVAPLNLVVDEPARESAIEIESVGLVEPGDVPVVLEEDFCEHGVDVADAFNASVEGFYVPLEDVEGSLGV